MEDSTKVNKPKKSLTVFLICCTMLLSAACICAGIYSLYISIGFRFMRRSAVGGLNTSTLYTYSNSGYGTGGGTMMSLILVSLVMLGLGIAMTIIFFKQLPLYKQIKLVAKLPNIKYKDYSQKVKKSVIVYSIIGYIVCIGFSIFSIVVAFNSGISANYLWIVIAGFSVVLALSISSMILMFLKLGQLSKIKKALKAQEKEEEEKPQDKKLESSKSDKNNKQVQDTTKNVEVQKPEVIEIKETGSKLFSDGIFELNSQLQKLREMHISGLIDSEEYTKIRQKWIDAVLSEPLFGKKTKTKSNTRNSKSNLILSGFSEQGESATNLNQTK